MKKNKIDQLINKKYPYLKNNVEGFESKRKVIQNLLKEFEDNSENILKFFPFKDLTQSDKETILSLLLDLKDEESREFLGNLNKRGHIDTIDKLIIKDSRTEFPSDLLDIELLEETDFIEFMYKLRDDIRHTTISLTDLQKHLIQIKEHLIYENMMLPMLGLGQVSFEQIGYYKDLILDILLQIIMYKIINNKTLSLSDREERVSRLLIFLKESNKSEDLHLKKRSSNKLILPSIEIVTTFFTDFIKAHKVFLTKKYITDILKAESRLDTVRFCEVSSIYKAEKIPCNPYDKPFKNIITEGKPPKNYSTEMAKTLDFINIFSTKYQRNSTSFLQDIKVYYRELFMSKQICDSDSKGRQARKIVNNLLDNPHYNFKSDDEHTFIREKLNRGYFRETTSLKLYYLKCDIEAELMLRLNKPYLYYNYSQSLYELQSFAIEALNFINILIEGEL